MTRNVLVVDDNVDSTMILRSILEAHGFTATVVHSGPEALQQLEREVPDAILLDVMMPEMSGFAVLERIRGIHATANVPVILVTARIQDDDVMSGYQCGADYYITKPCTAKQLLYGLELVLGRGGANAPAPAPKDEVA